MTDMLTEEPIDPPKPPKAKAKAAATDDVKAYLADRVHPFVLVDGPIMVALAAREAAGQHIRHNVKLYQLVQSGNVLAIRQELGL